ncbi:MAG: hypothetical protein FWE70_01735 [Oscillospiraceae bacterium]|nr:hypothetical protein [Oscillospiraceae bacterium]
MEGPAFTPLCFLNRDTGLSDIRHVGFGWSDESRAKGLTHSEWGFTMHRIDETMGQPADPPLAGDPSKIDRYAPPDPCRPERYAQVKSFVEANPDKYVIGSVGISGFNLMTFIRGFSNLLEDMALEPAYHRRLMDMVFGFEHEVVRNLCECGVDGVSFADDWGTQRGVMVDPAFIRSEYMPWYKRHFDLIHEYGRQVFFHSCGDVWEIIPDFIGAGVDALNLNQPDIFGIERLDRAFGGKVAFFCPVDHQTVAIQGTPAEIRGYAERLDRVLGGHDGGFMAMIEEYHSVGMPEENYLAIKDAFLGIRGRGRARAGA